MADLSLFIDAVTRGDLGTVTAMLAADPGLARRSDAEGATALHHAAFAAQHAVVDALLAAGADLNARDGAHGATPGGWALHRLRERGALLAVEIDDVRFALDRGDDVWVRRLVTRHAALKSARDHDGRPLAAHPRVRTVPELAALFASGDRQPTE
ncbi:MAG: hypothetical protein IT357_06080 [Gemmatimonadaceae bacterium]|nr:hypothetical protein [Gemmatimonadaceae bacterium]